MVASDQVVPLSIEMAAYDNPALQPDGAANGLATVDLGGPADEFQQSDPAKLRYLADPEAGRVPPEAGRVPPDGQDAVPEHDEPAADGCLTRAVVSSRAALVGLYRRHTRSFWIAVKTLLFLAYNAYLIGAIVNTVQRGEPIDYCDGVGFLIIITVLAYAGALYYYALKPCCGEAVHTGVLQPASTMGAALWSHRAVRYLSALLVAGGILVYLILDTVGERARLVSALGAVVFVLLCWLCSHHPGKVVWRHVLWGLGLQLCFGLLILRWEVGQQVFQCIGDKVNTFLSYTDEGSKFVFGFLVDNPDPDIYVFAFQVLPVIVFFSFAIQILYYYGIMQRVIVQIGWLLQVTVGTTACESLNAAANIFIGQSEAPLLIKPFISKLTMSELHAIMTGGFATIAGSVLAAYISFGVSPSHLLSASVMSAPAALAVSKLVYPETRRSRTTVDDINVEKGDEVNALDAASRGAMSVVKICGYIAASLIAFIAFIAFVNGVLGWLGELVSFEEAAGAALSFEYIASKVFKPVAWLMGAPWEDCDQLGELIALKTILNEFVAYSRLKEMVDAGELSARGTVIATYALCGFSNLGAMGIQISGISALAPERRSDLARLAFSAMLAGNVACFLTACIAGALVSDPSAVGAALAGSAATALAENATALAENATALAANATALAANATALAESVVTLATTAAPLT
ncbi:sodium/nucleoside cotransporter 1-like isoform X3 [Amphibalanus amphitrite]|uniref:sodium/nucleoside cotransporter 1-like isoform X3 n=1 Tax=Amphibalanus amphitrite TaxID=1232801 RepID=UPI001C90E624|nr:sodium/nucleoside cotransporter 1-like isoform X3 [Amphibalanus amphitrite]